MDGVGHLSIDDAHARRGAFVRAASEAETLECRSFEISCLCVKYEAHGEVIPFVNCRWILHRQLLSLCGYREQQAENQNCQFGKNPTVGISLSLSVHGF